MVGCGVDDCSDGTDVNPVDGNEVGQYVGSTDRHLLGSLVGLQEG